MFEKANCTVTYLQRIEFGPLKLNDLPLGEFRALTQEELDAMAESDNAYNYLKGDSALNGVDLGTLDGKYFIYKNSKG